MSRSLTVGLAIWGLSLVGLGTTCQAVGAEPRYPVQVNRYDLSTRQELLYSHWLRPLIPNNDSAKWDWPGEFVATLGTWAEGLLDGQKILEATHLGCPVDGQPALTPVDRLVADCAKILGIPKPQVIVRSDPYPRAYVVAIADKPYLVLTSSLLALYEGVPQELRFVVGRELGRIKCDGLQLRRVSYGLLSILQGLDDETIPAEARAAMLTYAVGRFLTWSRESEISADRAGLFCCGDPQIAYDALARQLHGLKADSQWIDPQSPEFQAEAIIRKFQSWEREPLVVAVRYLHGQSLESPYLVERLAALRQYVDSGHYEQVLNQTAEEGNQAITTLQRLELVGLAPQGQGVMVYLRVYAGDQLVMRTPTSARGTQANFAGFRTTISETVGEPLFFEIWEDGYLSDTLLGGFAVYPRRPEKRGPLEVTQHVPILWDWQNQTTQSRRGLASVKLRIVPVPEQASRDQSTP